MPEKTGTRPSVQSQWNSTALLQFDVQLVNVNTHSDPTKQTHTNKWLVVSGYPNGRS